MTNKQTIQILRLVRDGVTNPDELTKRCPFFSEDELQYLLKCPNMPLLILNGNFVELHENGYNLLDETESFEELVHLVEENNLIAKRSEKQDALRQEIAQEQYKKLCRDNTILIWTAVISCVVSIVLAIKTLFF